jgi:hypothetical protein
MTLRVGCKAGPACLFSHEAQATAPQAGNEQTRPSKQGPPARLPPTPTQQRSEVSHEMRQAVGPPMASDQSDLADDQSASRDEKTVSKPVSELQKVDPRQFELNQLRRRLSPEERQESGATALTFKLVPTDPDFPFEMTELRCTLRVPNSYPTGGQPSLRVSNPEMERGYQINVERGFESLVTTMPQSTLLGLINELDRRLEGFLMSEKAPTVKLVTNARKKTSTTALGPTAHPAMSVAISTTPAPPPLPSLQQQSPQQVAEAKRKRESDIRQLEARMGRHPLFSKSSDNLMFHVPLQIPKSSKLPLSLQSITSAQLYVPLSYNLNPCLVSFMDVSSLEADAVRTAFERHSKDHPELSLMAHVNHLAQNMHNMAVKLSSPAPKPSSMPPSPTLENQYQLPKEKVAGLGPADRPHIRIIPRPPEWDISGDTNIQSDSSATDGSDDDSSEYETDGEEGGAAIPPEALTTTDAGPELGILLSFPSLGLYGAELLQIYSISLTVKCDRCKEMKDVKSIRSLAPDDHSLVKHESCNKCASLLSIGGYSPNTGFGPPLMVQRLSI